MDHHRQSTVYNSQICSSEMLLVHVILDYSVTLKSADLRSYSTNSRIVVPCIQVNHILRLGMQ
jgi:hypothetical protein